MAAVVGRSVVSVNRMLIQGQPRPLVAIRQQQTPLTSGGCQATAPHDICVCRQVSLKLHCSLALLPVSRSYLAARRQAGKRTMSVRFSASSVCLSVSHCLSVCLSVSLCLSLSLSVCLSLSLSRSLARFLTPRGKKLSKTLKH